MAVDGDFAMGWIRRRTPLSNYDLIFWICASRGNTNHTIYAASLVTDISLLSSVD